MGLLRVLLAYSVIVSHVPGTPSTALWGIGPTEAVEVFFGISGFYMAMILETGYRRTRDFYLNRFLRIYPIYWVVAIATLVFWIATDHLSQVPSLGAGMAALMALVNVIIFGQDLAFFLQFTTGMGWQLGSFRASEIPVYDYLLVPQAWTLSLELTFYLIVPWLARWRTWGLGILLAGLIGLRLAADAAWGPMDDPLGHRFFLFEAMFFVAGVVAFRVSARLRAQRYVAPAWVLGGVYAAIIGYFVVMGMVRATGQTTGLLGLLNSRWFITFGLIALTPIVFQLTRSFRFDRRIGELSYPMYLDHLLIDALIVTTLVVPGIIPEIGITRWLLAVFGSIAVAVLLVQVAHPVDRIRAAVRARASNRGTAELAAQPTA